MYSIKIQFHLNWIVKYILIFEEHELYYNEELELYSYIAILILIYLSLLFKVTSGLLQLLQLLVDMSLVVFLHVLYRFTDCYAWAITLKPCVGFLTCSPILGMRQQFALFVWIGPIEPMLADLLIVYISNGKKFQVDNML